MLLRHIVISILLFAPALRAATPQLGPETPLAPVPIGPAVFEQNRPAIASNGRGFLAIWQDMREATGRPALYTTALNRDGAVIDPLGRRLRTGIGQSPLIASDGRDYLVYDASHAQRVLEDGSPIGEAKALNLWGDRMSLTSNGATYLLVARKFVGRTVAYLLELDGGLRATIAVPVDTPLSVAPIDHGYSVAGLPSPCGIICRPVLHTISEQEVATDTLLPVIADRRSEIVIAQAPDRILVAWKPFSPDWRIAFYIADRAGNLLTPQTNIAGAPADALPEGAAWDGSEFLITTQTNYATRSVVAVTLSGAISEVRQVSTSSYGPLALATNGIARVLVWPDRKFTSNGDIVAATAFRASSLGTQPAEVISLSGRAQVGVHIASAAGHTFGVWTDDELSEISGVIDGVAVTIARPEGRIVSMPGVVAGGGVFVVAWTEFAPRNETGQLLVRRYSYAGNAIDPMPVAVASVSRTAATESWRALNRFDAMQPPGLVFDGEAFAIVTRQTTQYRATRLSTSGVFDTVDVGKGGWWTVSVRPLAIGDRWVIPTSVHDPGFVSPLTPTNSVVIMSAQRPGGFAQEARLVAEDYFFGAVPLAAAHAEGRVTLAWPAASGLSIMQTSADGRLLGKAQFFGSNVAEADLAWNGTEYVAVWTEYDRTLKAMRFNSSAVALDHAPITFSELVAPFQPSITVSSTGVTIAYSRSDAASGGAPRAYVRTLDANPGSSSRRRAVGR